MPEDFEREHKDVLDRAMRLYTEKGKVRGQMWLEYPPSDKIRELRERVHRIENAYEHIRHEDTTPGPEDPFAPYRNAVIEDALDVINFAVFLVKQIERGQRG